MKGKFCIRENLFKPTAGFAETDFALPGGQRMLFSCVS